MKNKIFSVVAMVIALGCYGSAVYAGEITRVSESTRKHLPAGKGSDAIDGDWIMKNDKVVAVIGDAVYGREANMRVQSIQGAVIDFTTLAANHDYLAAFYPQGIPAEDSRRNPAMFAHRIEVIKADGSEIILQVIRNLTDRSAYECTTVYTLRDGEDFLRIQTIYRNVTSEPVTLQFADKLRMDMDIEREVSPLGKTKLAFMYNKWFNAAYAIYSPDGLMLTEKPKLASDPATGLLVAFQNLKSDESGMVTLARGERVEATRFLLCGKDVAGIQRKIRLLEKDNATLTKITTEDSNSQPVRDVFIEVSGNNDEIVSLATSDASGVAEIPLPDGDYTVEAFKVGHDTSRVSIQVHTEASGIIVKMNALSGITFHISETGNTGKIPVKVEFKGVNGHPDPFLGSFKRAEGTLNRYYSIEKDFEVAVPPGHYLVTVSRGPEYEPVQQRVQIDTGEKKTVDVALKRAFSSPQWMLADFHNHSAWSGDNDADTRSRIINIAASGVEFAPATEHNRISTYTDEIKKLGLQEYVASAAGIELTGPTGTVSGPNHQNAFPLTIQTGKQGGGAPQISGNVYTQVKRLYDYDSDKTKFVQHNHPGYGLGFLYFDADQDGIRDDGIGTREFTDAIELQSHIYDILNVTAADAKEKKSPVFYWLQMLNQGYRIFGTMTSDNHIIGDRGGLRAVYVYLPDDQPSKVDPYEVALNAKKGRMVMTNGPFMKVTVDGHGPGEELATTSKKLSMNVEVYSNSEIEIDRVQILIDGRQDKKLNFTKVSHPKLFASGGRQFAHSFGLPLKADANVIAVATGKRKPADVPLTSESKMPAPMAVSNPIFVDLNKDGFVPSKDTLGQPLPVGRLRSEGDD